MVLVGVTPREPFGRPGCHRAVGTTTEGHEVHDPSPGVPTPDLVALYQRQREAMVRLARLFTGSDAVAEEVVQDAFLRMHQLQKRPDNVDAYLRTTVANLSRNHLRRGRPPRADWSREKVVLGPEIDETLEALRRLPFRQRAVLTLRYYEDLSEADIARVLHCRLGTVKSSLHRGLSKLREELS